MKKYIVMLSVLLTISVIFNICQQNRWRNVYEKIAVDYQYSLVSTITYLSEMEKSNDTRILSLNAVRVWDAPKQLSEKGYYLNLMVTKPANNVNAFQKVGVELLFITNDIWKRNGITVEPTPGADNKAPSKDDLSKLTRIYQIYRKYFTDTVIWSRDYEMQREAILSAHNEIKQQGLDSVFSNQWILDAGAF